jgi:hypothetical protein
MSIILYSTSIHTYPNISIVNVFIYYLMFATTAKKMEATALLDPVDPMLPTNQFPDA